MRYLPLLFMLLFMPLITASCSSDTKVAPGATATTEQDMPSQVSYATTINFTNEGSMRAALWAGRIRTYESKRFTMLDSSVRVDFFNRAGEHSTRLTAARARVDDATKNMTAYDSVHIVSDSGTVVDTDSLVWDNAKQTLRSEAHVRIKEASGRITNGEGFESDQNLTNYRILRPTIQAPSSSLQSEPSTSAMPSNPPPSNQPGGTFGVPSFGVPHTSADSTKAPAPTSEH